MNGAVPFDYRGATDTAVATGVPLAALGLAALALAAAIVGRRRVA